MEGAVSGAPAGAWAEGSGDTAGVALAPELRGWVLTAAST